jgi:hypothetical protein
MTPCAGRHHVWGDDGTCTKCKAPKRGPGRPKKVAGQVVAGRLRATLGTAAPPATTPPPSPAAPPVASAVHEAAGAPGTISAPPPKGPTSPAAPPEKAEAALEKAWAEADRVVALEPLPPPKGWCKQAGKRLTTVFVAGTEWALEKFHRKANEPDEDDVDEFAKGLGQQLAVWFPDTAMTPGKTMLLAGGFIVAEMAIGSEKIPRKETIQTKVAPPSPPASPPADKGNGAQLAPSASVADAVRVAASTSSGTPSPPSPS